jgi:hypothetical protein
MYSVYHHSHCRLCNELADNLQAHNLFHIKIRYCHVCVCVTLDGVLDWIGFAGRLNTQLVSTTDYSATANLHTLQIATTFAKFFQPDVSSPALPW